MFGGCRILLCVGGGNIFLFRAHWVITGRLVSSIDAVVARRAAIAQAQSLVPLHVQLRLGPLHLR